MKILALFLAIISTNAETGTPILAEGKTSVDRFIALANSSKLSNFPLKDVSYRPIPNESGTLIDVEKETYLLFLEDFNNDGVKEYLLVYINSGTGHFSGIVEAYRIEKDKISELGLNSIIIKNLFPGKDLSRFHLYLANPFILKKNHDITLRFQDQLNSSTTINYRWNNQIFNKVAN